MMVYNPQTLARIEQDLRHWVAQQEYCARLEREAIERRAVSSILGLIPGDSSVYTPAEFISR